MQYGGGSSNIIQSEIGSANGIAPLDSNGLVPLANLPVSLTDITHFGVGVPSNSLGLNGDWYMNVSTLDIYGPKAIGVWGSVTITGATSSAVTTEATTARAAELADAKLNPAYGPGTMETGALFETMSRKNISNSGLTKGSGVFRGVLVDLPAGAVISSVSFWASGTGAGTPTNQWGAVLDSTGKVLATSADALTASWVLNTKKTFTMSSPLTIPAKGGYYLGNCVVASIMPTFFGQILTAVPTGSAPFVCGSVAGQTVPATIGSTLTLGQNTSQEYGFAS